MSIKNKNKNNSRVDLMGIKSQINHTRRPEVRRGLVRWPSDSPIPTPSYIPVALNPNSAILSLANVEATISIAGREASVIRLHTRFEATGRNRWRTRLLLGNSRVADFSFASIRCSSIVGAADHDTFQQFLHVHAP